MKYPPHENNYRYVTDHSMQENKYAQIQYRFRQKRVGGRANTSTISLHKKSMYTCRGWKTYAVLEIVQVIHVHYQKGEIPNLLPHAGNLPRPSLS